MMLRGGPPAPGVTPGYPGRLAPSTIIVIDHDPDLLAAGHLIDMVTSSRR